MVTVMLLVEEAPSDKMFCIYASFLLFFEVIRTIHLNISAFSALANKMK